MTVSIYLFVFRIETTGIFINAVSTIILLGNLNAFSSVAFVSIQKKITLLSGCLVPYILL
jgi:hypothetical protein